SINALSQALPPIRASTKPTAASLACKSAPMEATHFAVSPSTAVPLSFATWRNSTRRQTSSAVFIGTLPRRILLRRLLAITNWMVLSPDALVEMLAMRFAPLVRRAGRRGRFSRRPRRHSQRIHLRRDRILPIAAMSNRRLQDFGLVESDETMSARPQA